MNILIAIDSSATSQAALAATLAREWAEASEFRVLTVLPSKEKWINGQKVISSELYRAHRLIDSAVSEIETHNPYSLVMGQIDVGDPAKCILNFARSWPADLIVVGSYDRGPMERFFTGSVSRAVFQDADCSVLISRNIDEAAEVNRVLVAVDDSYNSKVAVDTLLTSRWPKNTQFKLLTAAKSNYGVYSFEPNSLAFLHAIEAYEEYLYGLDETLSQTKARLDAAFGADRVDCAVIEGNLEQVILETARDWDAHLILMGSSERPGMTLKLFGSLSQTIALKATCSVQAVRGAMAPLQSRFLANKRYTPWTAIASNVPGHWQQEFRC